ncbi:YiiX/YebB-like N1pC/P60 family cysteine hydrolase [Lacipirellula parvula]|uniref:Uncharacterized protein n=1 Tax=Lacipirellula parvula TaxID=2650471 RepID=A0A5K7X1E4_9BACT|nr:YiiX/YebB-like N1pC/P60 family cysteine hydrolase [Lacipirellula parvula]BBO30468.1 hypothetical protein PLANPX_0080 [Lacipirellula parvula]
MADSQLLAAARTVIQIDDYFTQLKSEAAAIFDAVKVAEVGYVTASQELAVRQLQLSYWKSRVALLELIDEIRGRVHRPEAATPEEFLIALAAAALLVDSARYLREQFHRTTVVRRKLDEPDPVYGIPPRMYDDVQRSLVSVGNAWHLWQATRYYDAHRQRLAEAEAEAVAQLTPLVDIIDRLRDRLRPSLWMFLRTRLRVRGRRAVRRIGRDMLGRALYAAQEVVSTGMAEVTVRPGHRPGLPPEIDREMTALVQPGDVLVVRKEYAATNYFLPGYWPHAALVIGSLDDLQRLGVAQHEHVAPRWRLCEAIAAERRERDSSLPTSLVLESMKDGVRVRSIASPLGSDSVIVLRPLLAPAAIGSAIVQAFLHEGKPYDFDFDFTCSHRMVCTEVVYRAYDGVDGLKIELPRHMGRYALAAGDLLRMALAGRLFRVHAVYSPAHGGRLEQGPQAVEIVRSVEGRN